MSNFTPYNTEEKLKNKNQFTNKLMWLLKKKNAILINAKNYLRIFISIDTIG